MNISLLRLLAVPVCVSLARRTELEAGPEPPFQVIERNNLRRRLDVWHPLGSSLAHSHSHHKVRGDNPIKRKNPAARRSFGSDGFYHPEPAPGPGGRQSFHLGKLEDRDERDDGLTYLVESLLSLVRNGLVSQEAEDRQSLVDSAQVSQ